MTTQYRSGPRNTFSLAGFLLALVMGAALFAVFVHRARTGLPGRLAALITGRTAAFDESVPVVVDHIQALNKLETVVYSLDTVVENTRSSPVLPDALAGDKILLMVHGQATAGIDLSRLKPEDVRIDPPDLNGTPSRSIHLSLPPSEIFNVSLDNTKTKVFARETGLLVPADQNLESDTRAKAQQELQAAALSDGILDAARKNARVNLQLLLLSLGFNKVEIT